MKENMKKTLYTVLTSQAFSTDGRFMFACSQFGDIASYNIEKIAICIENISIDDYSNPLSIFKCPERPISLSYHRNFLIVGSSNGLIAGFTQNNGIIQKKSWSINLPLNYSANETTEVNDMWVDRSNDSLYCVCGNSLYHINLDEGKVTNEFKGHTDYIHSVRGYDKFLITASEDGTVKIWDCRDSQTPTFNVEPAKCPAAVRNSFGKFVGSASISKEWVACGGGTKLTLYNLNHLNSRQPFHIFELFAKEIHVTDFIETDSLLVAGECNQLVQFSLRGDLISEITSSGPAIYSVVWQKVPQKNILSACGASNQIDVTTNFIYKDTSLNFYKKDKC